MTESYTADVDAWARASDKRLNVIVRQSTQDLFSLTTRTAPAKARGGEVKPGFVPRDTGFLAASAQILINGRQTGEGEDAAEFAIVGMEAGDTAILAWSAVYSKRVHYEGGWLWIDTHAPKWPDLVSRNVERAKRQVRG